MILFPDDNVLLRSFSVNHIYCDLQFQMPSQNFILLFHTEVAQPSKKLLFFPPV